MGSPTIYSNKIRSWLLFYRKIIPVSPYHDLSPDFARVARHRAEMNPTNNMYPCLKWPRARIHYCLKPIIFYNAEQGHFAQGQIVNDTIANAV